MTTTAPKLSHEYFSKLKYENFNNERAMNYFTHLSVQIIISSSPFLQEKRHY